MWPCRPVYSKRVNVSLPQSVVCRFALATRFSACSLPVHNSSPMVCIACSYPAGIDDSAWCWVRTESRRNASATARGAAAAARTCFRRQSDRRRFATTTDVKTYRNEHVLRFTAETRRAVSESLRCTSVFTAHVASPIQLAPNADEHRRGIADRRCELLSPSGPNRVDGQVVSPPGTADC